MSLQVSIASRNNGFQTCQFLMLSFGATPMVVENHLSNPKKSLRFEGLLYLLGLWTWWLIAMSIPHIVLWSMFSISSSVIWLNWTGLVTSSGFQREGVSGPIIIWGGRLVSMVGGRFGSFSLSSLPLEGGLESVRFIFRFALGSSSIRSCLVIVCRGRGVFVGFGILEILSCCCLVGSGVVAVSFCLCRFRALRLLIC